MKRLPYILLFLLVCRLTYAAAPSRTKTYTAGETILSSDVTENEDNIYNYLQAGVDTYAALSINNADVSASANIQSDKLNLTSIVQGVAITSSGSLTNAGTMTQSGNATLSGTVGISGALTVTGNSTFAGTTIADLGTVTTGVMTAIEIQSGSIDNVEIGGDTSGSIVGTTIKADTSLELASGSTVTAILDEDAMGSDSDTSLATQQSIKAYVDDTTLSGFGSWTTATESSSTQASTDGFIVIISTGNPGGWTVKTDSANPPTLVRSGKDGSHDSVNESTTTPVKKNEYYLIEATDVGAITSYWIPLS